MHNIYAYMVSGHQGKPIMWLLFPLKYLTFDVGTMLVKEVYEEIQKSQSVCIWNKFSDHKWLCFTFMMDDGLFVAARCVENKTRKIFTFTFNVLFHSAKLDLCSLSPK